jgi:putative heme-binding domain-containing protein
MRVLGETRREEAVTALLEILETSSDVSIRSASLASLRAFDAVEIDDRVLRLYGSLDRDTREVAGSLLASRERSAWALLEAIQEERISRDDISHSTRRALSRARSPGVRTLSGEIFGDDLVVDPAVLEREIARIRAVIDDGNGSPYPGKKLFRETCGRCHTLFGDGGSIGPDLTPYRRDDVDSLLLGIISPSAEIREGFENMTIVTRDGRAWSGFTVDQDRQIVVIRGADGESVSIRQNEIETLEPAGSSLMPEGLLTPLGDQEIRDLFAYLRSTQPLAD